MDIAKYVQFYLDLMASQDNVSLLHHLAMKAKTVRDADSHSEVRLGYFFGGDLRRVELMDSGRICISWRSLRRS